jgi:hypothetical protein
MRYVVLFLALFVVGCANKTVTPATPKAADALKADAIVLRVNELQATVIEACGPGLECQAGGGIETGMARSIVQASIDVRGVLRRLPDGWRATVKQTWATLHEKLVMPTSSAIAMALSFVDALIGGL